jgi:hypothetical protein
MDVLKMKLAIAFTLAMLLPATAQIGDLPKTGNLIDNATKEVIGTVTFSGNRAYLRDKDGTRTAYDDSGNVIPMPEVAK